MFLQTKISPLAVVLAILCTVQYTHSISVSTNVDRNVDSSEGLSEQESYSTGYRGRQYTDARPSHHQTNKRQYPRDAGVGSTQGKSNVVYGKGKVEQPQPYSRHQYPKVQKPKYQSSKFVPSPEVESPENEGSPQRASQYDPVLLQKYMQKYANQLYNAQKYSSQLSDAQKQVLSQDGFAKKYAQPQAQKSPKISVDTKYPPTSQSLKYSEPIQQNFENKFAEQLSLQDYAEPTLANPQFQVQKFVSQHRVPKPKKVNSYLYDNAGQSTTDYKYQNLYGSSLEPQVLNQYFGAAAGLGGSADKEYTTGYETHQAYGQYGTGSTDRLETPKITGYKIPSSVAASSYGNIDHVVDEKTVAADDKGYDDHHHHAEPKYEYMYQVQDHEKHNHFGHSEARKGKQTWGKYYVQLPDGRFETVKYWADKSGYHAQVEFKGHAKHPAHKEHHYKGYDKADETAAANSYSNFGAGQSEEYQ